MECSCQIECDVDDFATMLNKSRPKARKEHRCYECHRIIQIDEVYLREVSVYDGKVDTYKTCADCASLREVFFCGGWYWGGVIEEINEMVSESWGAVPEYCLSILTPNARAYVCERIEREWEEDDD